MNVFEDLIGELKDENLLEDTVIDVSQRSKQAPSHPIADEAFALVSDDTAFAFESNSDLVDLEEAVESASDSENDFYRKRAVDEVSSLQMVEHVLSGVEREHMKMPAANFDDLQVKTALHRFIQATNEDDPDARTEAEYQLLQETQNWHTALANRNSAISVANLRRFCENSRPVLSSQALMALARFYRNSAFTEDVRCKFEFVMTRLFSRDAGLERRKLLFNRDEMIGHIKTLYGNWSSITYHTAEEHQSAINLSVQRFDDLVRHFDGLQTFDELLGADVFSTIRLYKEECGELFFAPAITSAALICNVRLGNRYVELILQERDAFGGETIEQKYGLTNDQDASFAAGKTLVLSQILRAQVDEDVEDVREVPADFEQESFDVQRSVEIAREPDKPRSSITGVNKWLVVATVIITLISGGIYLWADKFAGADGTVVTASEISLEGTPLTEHLRKLRKSNETAYGTVQPSWDGLTENEQKKFLQKVLEYAQTQGTNKVNLLNYKGRTVAFASKDRLDIYPPS